MMRPPNLSVESEAPNTATDRGWRMRSMVTRGAVRSRPRLAVWSGAGVTMGIVPRADIGSAQSSRPPGHSLSASSRPTIDGGMFAVRGWAKERVMSNRMVLVCECHELSRARERGEDVAPHDVLSLLRGAGRPAHCLRARLAGAVDQLAASASLLRGSRLSRGGSRHARLRAVERVLASRGLRAPAHRPRHGRATGRPQP